MLFVFEGGEILVEGKKIEKLFAGSFFNEANVYKNLKVSANEKFDSRFLCIFGKPFNQPVCQRGPVVMCSQDEVFQAFMDYRNGVNGFEGAFDWKSENSKLVEE